MHLCFKAKIARQTSSKKDKNKAYVKDKRWQRAVFIKAKFDYIVD
jgi:hypothetical protein